MSDSSSSAEISPRRRRIATALLVLATLGALYAFVTSIATVRTAGPESVVAETWRSVGLLVFAGLFSLLAYRPWLYPGVWELVIFHKAATAGSLLLSSRAVPEAVSTAVVDGVLTIVLVAAYLLVDGYTAWDRLRTRSLEPSTGG